MVESRGFQAVLVPLRKTDCFCEREWHRRSFRVFTSLFAYIFSVLHRASHFVRAPWIFRILHPLVRRFMNRSMRRREVIHDGSGAEMLQSLARYGITGNIVPKEIGGELEINRVGWLLERLECGL